MDKKVLLLFYPSTVPEGHSRFSMPYALLYLERVLRDLNLEIIIIDEDIVPDYRKEIEKRCKNIDFVGVSTMTGHQIKGAINFSKYIRENYNDAKIIWGGWHPSVMPEQTLKESFIDFLVHGQGELAFKETITALINNKVNFSSIKNLAFKENNKIIVNQREAFYCTNNFPPINFGLIDVNKYLFCDTLVYFASHGCIYECGFCAMSTMYNKKWFSKPIETIIADLSYLKSNTDFKCINFQDDNFFVNRNFTISLCEAIIEVGLTFEFMASGHSRNLLNYSDKDFEIIYKAGCRKIFMGAESGSQEVLDIINKKETVENNFAVARLLKKHNIRTVFSTMVCLPLNPENDLKLTLNMIREAKLIDENLEILIFYYTPYPQTPLYNLALNNGFTPPSSLEEWSNYTMFNSKLAWHKKHFKNILECFYNYYFPFYNKSIEKITPLELKSIVKLFIRIFYKLNGWRFRNNCFLFPLDAWLMLYFLKRYNKKHKTLFCFSGTWSFFENRYF